MQIKANESQFDGYCFGNEHYFIPKDMCSLFAISIFFTTYILIIKSM